MPNVAAQKSFSLEIERTGAKAMVRCHGRLVAGMGDSLSQRVRELLPESKCIVLDLTDVSYVDSMGLGVLVRLYVSTKRAGSRLELINLGKQLREMLGVTNLLSVFGEMCENGVTLKF